MDDIVTKKYLKNYYNRTNTCDICGEKLSSGNAHREYDKKDEWTGRWLCRRCYNRHDRKRKNIYRERYISDHRTGNLNPDSNAAKGYMFELLTCEWRGVMNLNIYNDNFLSPIDHSRDPELGIIQTKGRLYNCVERRWPFNGLDRDHNKIFDYMICYCADKHGKFIERIYIFPRSEIMKRTGISILKNPSYGGWYEEYRVTDERVLYQINDIFRRIVIEVMK